MRIRSRLAVLATIPALALGVGLATAAAGSAATTNISFKSSAGNGAHWNADHTALVLVMNNANASPGQGGVNGGYAIAFLHGTPSALPGSEPTFNATNYASGTPRMDIFLSNGEYFFVYPDRTWQFNNSTGTVDSGSSADWSTKAVADADSQTVTQVFIVADASQPVPYTSTVDSVVYAGTTYVP